jgi:hypothetical protein
MKLEKKLTKRVVDSTRLGPERTDETFWDGELVGEKPASLPPLQMNPVETQLAPAHWPLLRRSLGCTSHCRHSG